MNNTLDIQTTADLNRVRDLLRSLGAGFVSQHGSAKERRSAKTGS